MVRRALHLEPGGDPALEPGGVSKVSPTLATCGVKHRAGDGISMLSRTLASGFSRCSGLPVRGRQ